MATLMMEPAAAPTSAAFPAPAASTDDTKVTASTGSTDSTAAGDIDAEWVLVQQSDVDGNTTTLGFAPTPAIFPVWTQWVVGSITYVLVPFYKRALKREGEVVQDAETVLETVERASLVTENFASKVSNSIQGDNVIKRAALKVETIAEEVNKDAEMAEAVVEKVDSVTKHVDAVLEPLIAKMDEEIAGMKSATQSTTAQTK